ncbi:ABC transporter permease [Phaeovulum sp. W22_SRMD_FR3]|uniref:ABC transporter permease n=1 Tax=Phaeovulum sp. W22_SRMD_FR3 TaxID=3240274 RepID=UPI003F94B489
MVEATPRWIAVATAILLVLAVVFLIAPLLVVIGVSFTAGDYISFPPQGLSLRWYIRVLAEGRYTAAALTSLAIAVPVTLAAAVLGAGTAIALHRRLLPGSGLISGLFLAPIVLPSIILGLGLLMLWSRSIGPTSLLTIFIGHLVLALPYVIRTTLAVLTTSDTFLEEAARTMGAGPWRSLWRVTVPQCLPGIAAGAFFAFNISFDEAVVSLFLRSPEVVTLPIQIYTQLEFSPDPSIAAVSSLMIGLTIVLIVLIERAIGLQNVTE